jgi:major membrane immunogen (membrane-anchored lipoprotein)
MLAGPLASLAVADNNLQVNISPEGAGGWRVKTPQNNGAWAGQGAFSLDPGDYTLEFKDDQRYEKPANKPVTIVSGQLTTVNAAYKTFGTLKVTLPQAAENNGAKWYVTPLGGGEMGPYVNDSAAVTIPALKATVRFQTPVTCYTAPDPVTLDIPYGQQTTYDAAYTKFGSVTVNINPEAARGLGRWSLTGTDQDGKAWHEHGSVQECLQAGNYQVAFQENNPPGWKEPETVTATVQDEKLTTLTGLYAAQTGVLKVSVTPAGLATKASWRTTHAGGQSGWRLANQAYKDAPIGQHSVEFSDVLGYTTPADADVTVTAQQTTTVPGAYARQTDGNLTVTIEPQAARDAGAQWRIVGTETWYNSGATMSGAPIGDNAIEFKDVLPTLKPCGIVVTVAPDTKVGSGVGTYCDPDQGVPLVFDLPEGKTAEQVFIHFLTSQFVCGFYRDASGQKQQLAKSTAYKLSEITSPTPLKPGLPAGKPAVVVNSFQSGRVYISYDSALDLSGDNYQPAPEVTTDKNYAIRYQYFEPTCTCSWAKDSQTVTTWADLSYIDFISIPVAMKAVNAVNGENIDQWTKADTLTMQEIAAPTAKVPGQNVVLDANENFVRVLAPMTMPQASMYPDWSDYLTSLQGVQTRIKGCYVGTGDQPTGNPLTQAQSYDFIVTVDAGNNALFTAQEGSGKGNDICLPEEHFGTGVGATFNNGDAVTVSVSFAELNGKNGIYGNNPSYTYTYANAPTGATTDSIKNDVFGRVVGDFLAGLSFGYPGSTVTYNGKAIKDLSSTQWWGGRMPFIKYQTQGSEIALKDTPAGKNIFFAQVQPDKPYYHQFAAVLPPLTTGYGFALQDRLGTNLIKFETGAQSTSYLNITLNPDRYVQASEIGVINPASTPFQGTLRGYNSSGSQVWSQSVSLPAYGRLLQDMTNDAARHLMSYLTLNVTSGQAVGYQKSSISQRHSIGIEALPPQSGQDMLYIPYVLSNKDDETLIGLVNTANTAKTLTFTFNTGATASKLINAGDSALFSVASLFGGVKQPDIKAGRITGADGVSGVLILERSASVDGMPLSDDAQATMYFPHLAQNQQWWTGLVFYNSGTQNAKPALQYYAADGSSKGSWSSLHVDAGQAVVATPDTMHMPSDVAWFELNSDQPVTGLFAYGDHDGDQMAGYSAVNMETEQGVFPYLDHVKWNGVSLVNTGDDATTVTLEARDDSGAIVASVIHELSAKGKWVGLVPDLFTGKNIAGATYIRFTSSPHKVAGFQLVGNSDQTMLDGIPALGASAHTHGGTGKLVFQLTDIQPGTH